MHSGEFIEEQIFNWTYSDEQSAKENWKGENNPYLSLPRIDVYKRQICGVCTVITIFLKSIVPDVGEQNLCMT